MQKIGGQEGQSHQSSAPMKDRWRRGSTNTKKMDDGSFVGATTFSLLQSIRSELSFCTKLTGRQAGSGADMLQMKTSEARTVRTAKTEAREMRRAVERETWSRAVIHRKFHDTAPIFQSRAFLRPFPTVRALSLFVVQSVPRRKQ